MKISKRSILTFLNVNGTLISISLIKYLIFYNLGNINIFYKFSIMYSIYIVRNYTMMFLLFRATKHKQFINPENEYNNSNNMSISHLYVFSTTLLDTITNVFLYNKLINNTFSISTILKQIMYFIPVSFCFEIILDFFRYWVHRLLHLNKGLYRMTHKIHHKYTNPVSINAYHFSPFDLIASISIPMILTILILPYNLSLFEFMMISVYKQYTELAGHSGKMLSPASSFPQCIWLPRLLNIELYAEDHDSHHKLSNCNFAKRFSLWDKIFGTYNNKIKSSIKIIGLSMLINIFL